MKNFKKLLKVSSYVLMGVGLGQSSCDSGSLDMMKLSPPIISEIFPKSVINTGEMITIRGSGFQNNAMITVGGAPCINADITATQITCNAPAKPGICAVQPVVVTNPDMQSATDGKSLIYRTSSLSFAKTDLSAAVGVSTATVADFNKDGKLDIVNTNRTSGTVTYFQGNGDGTFGIPTTVLMNAPDPVGIDAGDFNRDGKLDLAIALYSNGAGQYVAIANGNGNGTFSLGNQFSSPELKGPYAIKFADLDGDTKLDILVGSLGFNNMVIAFMGNGSGDIKGAKVSPIGGATNFVAVADINHDGKLDLAASSPAGFVAIRLGDGTGSFAGTTNISGIPNAGQVAIADLNRDTLLDIAVSSKDNSSVTYATGKGDGTFNSSQTVSAGVGAYGTAIVDINADGSQDIIVANSGIASVMALLGNGAAMPMFTGSAANTFPIGTNAFSTTIADLNSDGLPDIITANGGSTFTNGNTVSVLVQQSQCK
ncbi:MAG: FG-GAP-like repeat-containing protein [Polyangia bacterium]